MSGYAFLAPAFFFFLVFLVIPAVGVLIYTFRSGGIIGPTNFIGFKNWQEAFQDPIAIQSLKNTVKYALIAIPGMLITGMLIAMALRNVGRGSAILRAGIYIPTLAPPMIAGMIWIFMVHPDFGALNFIIRGFGGEHLNFLGDRQLALPIVAVVEIWRGLGFWSVFFLAALLGLPKELYEAAYMDGTNARQRFIHITLPLLRPTILFAVVQATIYNLQIFDTVFVMTDGSPAGSTASIVWYIYRTLFTYGNVGYGATLSFILLVLIMVLTLILMRLLRGRRVS
jgi:ABC-type sugar transport system permease subunit